MECGFLNWFLSIPVGHAQIRNHFKKNTEKYCKAKTLHPKTSFKEDQIKASFMWYSMKLPLNYAYS